MNTPDLNTPIPAASKSRFSLGLLPDKPRYRKLMSKQVYYLKDDGINVTHKFLIGRLMYRFLAGAAIVGIGGSGYTLYQMIYPSKKE